MSNGANTRAVVVGEITPPISDDALRQFRREGDSYVLSLPALGIDFRVDRLRRERNELVAELSVECDMAGVRKTGAGCLSVADMNLSSLAARTTRAKYLRERSNAPDVDWTGLLEELCQRVIVEDRVGHPSVSLRDIPLPATDRVLEVLGVPLLLRHPVILFGDGGASKSYLALYIAAELARQGVRVGFLDWELDGGDHRARLEAMYGQHMPDIRYKRCDRPLVHMRDEVQRMVRADRLQYLLCDSIAFACDSKPEDAEAAQRYMQTVRAAGVGSLHIAHISKAEGGDQKPFGSAFWHNGARATWYVKPAQEEPGAGRLHLALLQRKANLSGKLPPRGVTVTFGERTTFVRSDLRDVPELATTLPAGQRVRAALRHGTLSKQALAEELDDIKADTLKKTLAREIERGAVVQFPGTDGHPRYGLKAHQGAS